MDYLMMIPFFVLCFTGAIPPILQVRFEYTLPILRIYAAMIDHQLKEQANPEKN